MAAAESCTGGWIAQSLTALAGSSNWFDTGFVTYSNDAKQKLLDVPKSYFEIDGAGAVSEETVLAMTQGAINNSRANVAVAVSGIAGPDGGSEDRPVGTVWIARADRASASTEAHAHRFSGDRADIRAKSANGAMNLLRLHLLDEKTT